MTSDLPNVDRSVPRGCEDELLGGVEAQRVDGAGVAGVLQQRLPRVHPPDHGCVVGRGRAQDGEAHAGHTNLPDAVLVPGVPV